ncbi:MAG: potassium transporter TrkG [Lachnospiraceae bacterium]
MKTRIKNITRAQTIALGFFLIIMTGTLLLMLPIASREGHTTNLMTALFTATSATCVTGLIVVDTYQYWSVFGQVVIMMLIQIGGMGFVTVGVWFAVFLRRKIDLKGRGLIQESINTIQIGGVVRLVKKVVMGTAIFELTGAFLLSFYYVPRLGFIKGVYNGIFHAISAFCNAGFDLMGRNGEFLSFTGQYDNILINAVIMSLIVIGGIGFIVWDDISERKWHIRSYMLHTKIVLTVSFALIIGGAILFYVMESGNLMEGMSVKGKICSSLFSSVTARTAGFNTLDIASFTEGSKFLSVILMFIGGSPGSTAGGIKTTTLAVMTIFIWSRVRSGSGCNLYNRRITDDIVTKAAMVFGINLLLGISGTLIICSLQNFPVGDVLFEVFSAIGTVGMSTGITRDLNMLSKIVVVLLMYMGRIGSMTFALAFAEKRSPVPVTMPTEKITVG